MLHQNTTTKCTWLLAVILQKQARNHYFNINKYIGNCKYITIKRSIRTIFSVSKKASEQYLAFQKRHQNWKRYVWII